MKKILVLKLLVDVDSGISPQRLAVAFESAQEEAYSTLRKYKIEVVGSTYIYDNPTRQESITMTPIRKHFGIAKVTACDRKSSRITNDWGKVTCKMCLRKKTAISPQKELFLPE